MESNNRIALLSGTIGGLLKYMQLLQVPASFFEIALRAALVGIISGAAGVIGKLVVMYVKRKYYAKLVVYIKSKCLTKSKR